MAGQIKKFDRRITLYVSQTAFDDINEEAIAKEVNASDVVRWAIRDYFSMKKAVADQQNLTTAY